MGRRRLSRDDCRRLLVRVMDPLHTGVVERDYDVFYDEEGAVSELGVRGSVPDCIAHRRVCTYVVVEYKASNLERAYNQLVSFASTNHELHKKVELYVVVLESGRQLKRLLKGRRGERRSLPTVLGKPLKVEIGRL